MPIDVFESGCRFRNSFPEQNRFRTWPFRRDIADQPGVDGRLQAWVQAKGARVIVIFEGRDTAGKGGVINRITARTSPRVYRHVALPTPSDREKTQAYFQRYVAHFPAAGEIILFDRSWYNRAGVERVMGFCSSEQYERFLKLTPGSSRRASSCLSTFSMSARMNSGALRGQNQRSGQALEVEPMDTESVRRWWDYTAAYQRMIEATHTSGGTLVYRPGRRQAPRPAEFNPAPARHHPLQESQGGPAEDPQNAASAQGCYRGSRREPADPQSLLRTAGLYQSTVTLGRGTLVRWLQGLVLACDRRWLGRDVAAGLQL